MFLDLDRVYEMQEPPLLFTNPKLLSTAPIPIPLHGRNPRTIRGSIWWNEVRKKAYKENNYHCFACGVWKFNAPVHQWLEGHEVYKVNARTGRVDLKEVVALCHSCHNFIHMGRLSMLLDSGNLEISEVAKQIILHGLSIVQKSEVKITKEMLKTAEYILGKRVDHNQYKIWASFDYSLPWNRWYLMLDDKRYYSLFKNEYEHRVFYASANQTHQDSAPEFQASE